MNKNELLKLKNIFSSFEEVKLAYLFGSRARGDHGPMSDYDFAVFLSTRDKKKMFSIKVSLMDKISLLLKTDKVDIVVLNELKQPELKYFIIKEGELILEREPFKLIIEPQIMNEYFDFQLVLQHNYQTKK